MPDPTHTSVPATPRMSRNLKRLLFIATIGFVFLLRFTTNEILLTVLGIVALIGLVYYLASGQASPDSTGIYPADDLSRFHLYSGDKETLVSSLECFQRTSAEILAAITPTQ
jgi:hypothetical protein